MPNHLSKAIVRPMVMRQAKINIMPRFYALMALFLLFPLSATADEGQEQRVFSVYGVHVDVTSKTALAARADALNKGVRYAFATLVEKLIDSDSAAHLSGVSIVRLSALVQSIEVVDEKTSTTRYIGDLNIGFSPEKVREFFALRSLRYSEIEGETHLVLPVLKQNGGYRLWTEFNAWWPAWSKGQVRNKLLRYATPERDFEDQMTMGAVTLWSNDMPLATDELVKKYDAKSILIVRGEYKHHSAFDRPVLEFSYRKGGDNPLMGEGKILALAGDDAQSMASRAAMVIRWRLDEHWKAQTLTDFAHSLSLNAECETQSAMDLVAIRQALEEVSIIHGLSVERIGVPVSEVSISFTGSLEQLQLALRQVKLELSKRPSGHWFLSHSDKG